MIVNSSITPIAFAQIKKAPSKLSMAETYSTVEPRTTELPFFGCHILINSESVKVDVCTVWDGCNRDGHMTSQKMEEDDSFPALISVCCYWQMMPHPCRL